MRQALRAVTVLALLAAWPGRAVAWEWTANAGVEYQQLDAQATGSPATSVPRLDVNLTLDTRGGLPGILGWSAGVGYRRLAITREGLDDVREQLNYRLRTSILGGGLVAADAHASLTDESVSLESVSSTNVRSTVYGGALRLQAVHRPYLTASYNYTGTEIENPAIGDSDRTVHSVSASTGFGSPSYTYRASYQLNLSEGTYALDAYDDHRVEVLVDADVATNARLTLSDGYYLRDPGPEASLLSPRHETNMFLANLRVDSGRRDVQSVNYGYSHALRSFVGRDEVERMQHRLGYSLQRELPDPEWRIRGDLRLTYGETRIDGDPSRSAGQSLGLTAFWRRTRKPDAVEVHVGSSVGLLEPEGEDTRVGYGATAGGFVNRLLGGVSTSLSYDAGYSRDMDADAGWALTQALTGSASGQLGLGSLRGALQLSASRRDHPLFGTAASRAVTATSGYRWRRHDLYLQASLQDGGDGLPGGFNDGLFLAPAYDSHTRSVIVGAATSPWTVLTLHARARYASTDLPDRPMSDEKEAFGSIQYAYGALRLSIEDRYVIAATPGGELRVNQIFLRASRSIGSRY